MSDDFKEKLRSLSFQGPRSSRSPQTTVDDHGTHQVAVTEHWNDRVDVTVKPEPIRLRVKQEN